MAVMFAVIGGAAAAVVGGITVSDPYSNYSNHSDYSNYDNYSNYSDAAERRERRIAAMEEEVRQSAQEVNQYKINRVNGYLENRRLISEPGETVSVYEVGNDGYEKIEHDEKKTAAAETRTTQQEIEEINAAIAAIDRILEDKKP